MKPSSFLPTRRSLIHRLADKDDQLRWREFFSTYHRLIFNTARRAGLQPCEAEEVVQETVINVARNIGRLKYDPSRGSFKGWLLTITRWRIVDQFRKRNPHLADLEAGPQNGSARTAALDRLPQSASADVEQAWEQEWRSQVLAMALETVKKRTEPRAYQIFDCYELQHWPAAKVAKELRVNIAQVYLVRHRVLAALKVEAKRLERGKF